MLLRTWDAETIHRSIPWLRARNAGGAAIYIRPHGEHHLSLVDDLSAQAVQQMKGSGFEPTLVVETSPGNFQAWLNHGRILDKKTSTAAARVLAERFGGDPGAADWRHFGRLAGFANKNFAIGNRMAFSPMSGSRSSMPKSSTAKPSLFFPPCRLV